MIGQSVVAQAYGNWAAVAYVPLTLVVVGWLLRRGRHRWLVASVSLHLGLAAVALGAIAGDTLSRARGGCGFAVLDRHLGWDIAGSDLAERLHANPDLTLISDDREVLAPLIYYARLEPGYYVKWRPSPVPDDHYAYRARLTTLNTGPWVLPSLHGEPADILTRFRTARSMGRLTVPLSVCRARAINYYELDEFQGY